MKGEKKVVVTTPLAVDVLEELKYRTGETTTKKALVEAVNHYLECSRSSGDFDRIILSQRK